MQQEQSGRGTGRDLKSAIAAALDRAATLKRKMLLLVPPPPPSEGANRNAHDFDAFLGLVRHAPDKLAFPMRQVLSEYSHVTIVAMKEDIQQASRTLYLARYTVEQKAEVHATLEAILGRLDGMQRGPDPWEEACLVLALNYMDSGLYARARRELDDCILPVGDRSEWREEQIKRNPRGYTMARLRMRLAGARAANM